jgi:hypothetical protein
MRVIKDMAQTGTFKRTYGRKDRLFNSNVPHFSALRMGAKSLSPIPANKNWADLMPVDLEMLMNDTLGDCTCAATLHARQVWTFNTTGTMAVVTDAQALWEYETWAGYINGDASTDNGAAEQTILTEWLKQGIPIGTGGHTNPLHAFIEIDPRNLNDVRRAIYECGVVYIGFDVPQSLENGDPPALWDVVPGQEQPVGGHAIILTGYDASSFNLISWGMKYAMTTNFFETFTDECYALVSTDWVNSTGSTPLGMTMADLDARMASLRN